MQLHHITELCSAALFQASGWPDRLDTMSEPGYGTCPASLNDTTSQSSNPLQNVMGENPRQVFSCPSLFAFDTNVSRQVAIFQKHSCIRSKNCPAAKQDRIVADTKGIIKAITPI
jgi:hypothetical protein